MQGYSTDLCAQVLGEVLRKAALKRWLSAHESVHEARAKVPGATRVTHILHVQK